MKCMFCRKCGSLVPMAFERRSCKCGNITGNYLPDGTRIEVSIKVTKAARVVGISNSFLREEFEGWDDPSYDGTLFKSNNSHIVIVLPFTTGDVISIIHCPDCFELTVRLINNGELVHYCSLCNRYWSLSDIRSKEPSLG